jgi:hypothetical protein
MFIGSLMSHYQVMFDLVVFTTTVAASMGQLVITFAVHHPRLPCFHHQLACTNRPSAKINISELTTANQWCECGIQLRGN